MGKLNNEVVRSKLTEIKKLKKIIAEYENKSRKRNTQDIRSVQVFINSNYEKSFYNDTEKFVDLYNEYKEWCKENEDMYRFSVISFEYYLHDLGFDIRKVSRSSNKFVFGIRKKGDSIAPKTNL
ncbi:hypothetical protein ABEV83_12650 [Bacillus licheniformis]|uniref:hypothetical protein n=1 Tax=Bacillus subtilis group TaxID=653685 RepID=UPI002DDCB913|nr:hypothetical protein [Bacillus licheniformis]